MNGLRIRELSQSGQKVEMSEPAKFKTGKVE